MSSEDKYRRRLTATEVKYGFFYISDRGFRKDIPRYVEIKAPELSSKSYSLKFDEKRKRIGWSRALFREYNLKEGDEILFSKVGNVILLSKVEK
jgi:isopenicillin N synthase-like dioxygenase